MSFSPMLAFHICAGTVGLLSGGAAMSFRKGSQRHRRAGNVFVISMLGLGASGAYMGFMKHQLLNGVMGTLTSYLVATAWWTARRRDEKTGLLDWGGLLVPLSLATVLVICGIAAKHTPTGAKYGVPTGSYFVFATLAGLYALGDLRMLIRGSISGTQRLTRHLGRMCFALFIASGSLFLARPHLFPALLIQTHVIFLLGILPLVLMVFWLIRVRFTNAYTRKPMPHAGGAYTVRT